MKVWTCCDFKGRYPIGTVALVVAEDKDEAANMLDSSMIADGLKGFNGKLIEVDLKIPGVFMLNEGVR
jgi:hypothetical protein